MAPGEEPYPTALLFRVHATPTVLTVQPSKSTVYIVAGVENSCGAGSMLGASIDNGFTAHGEEEFADGQLRIYPNPAQEVVQIADNND